MKFCYLQKSITAQRCLLTTAVCCSAATDFFMLGNLPVDDRLSTWDS